MWRIPCQAKQIPSFVVLPLDNAQLHFYNTLRYNLIYISSRWKGQEIMMIDYSGRQIGSYRLQRRPGFGGFASVYLGQHVRIATQQAAIKLLHIIDVDSKKFQQEAETTAALVHPQRRW